MGFEKLCDRDVFSTASIAAAEFFSCHLGQGVAPKVGMAGGARQAGLSDEHDR